MLGLQQAQTVLFIILFLWLLIITVFSVIVHWHYFRISRAGKKESMPSILEHVLQAESDNKKEIAEVKKLCEKLGREGVLHIQKVGLIRFNPFNDTGGDQSFILALVDGEESGVVISSLHTRIGTRWYAKQIVRGKGVGHELSDEEVQAIKTAKAA